MAGSETINQLQKKILKILGLLFLIRLGLYIPVPNVDLDIFAQNQVANPLFGLAKNDKWSQWFRFLYLTFFLESASVGGNCPLYHRKNPEEFLARIEAKTSAERAAAASSKPKEFSLPGQAKEKLAGGKLVILSSCPLISQLVRILFSDWSV